MRLSELFRLALDRFDGTSGLKEYLSSLPDCTHTEECTLVDAGAIGSGHFRWHPLGTKYQTYRFDPNFETHQEQGKTRTFPIALSDSNSPLRIRIAKKIETSSFFEPNAELLARYGALDRFKTLSTSEVASQPLSEVLKSEYWFAKLDVQGMELDILHGARASIDRLIGVEIEMEFSPMYREQPLIWDVGKFLWDEGLEFIDFMSLNRWNVRNFRGPGTLMFSDGLFFRSPEWVAEKNDVCLAGFYLSLTLSYSRLDLAGRLVSLYPELNSHRVAKLLRRLNRRLSLQRKVVSLIEMAIRPVMRGSTTYLVK